jgi:hypothetical protein
MKKVLNWFLIEQMNNINIVYTKNRIYKFYSAECYLYKENKDCFSPCSRCYYTDYFICLENELIPVFEL